MQWLFIALRCTLNEGAQRIEKLLMFFRYSSHSVTSRLPLINTPERSWINSRHFLSVKSVTFFGDTGISKMSWRSDACALIAALTSRKYLNISSNGVNSSPLSLVLSKQSPMNLILIILGCTINIRGISLTLGYSSECHGCRDGANSAEIARENEGRLVPPPPSSCALSFLSTRWIRDFSALSRYLRVAVAHCPHRRILFEMLKDTRSSERRRNARESAQESEHGDGAIKSQDRAISRPVTDRDRTDRSPSRGTTALNRVRCILPDVYFYTDIYTRPNWIRNDAGQRRHDPRLSRAPDANWSRLKQFVTSRWFA